jgi:hypothetical protein
MKKSRRTRLPEPELPADSPAVRFIERPDGVYWRYSGRSEEFGPFKTLAEAAADAESRDDSDYEPGASLEEAEREIGVAEWVDPETGAPAEESVPRLEDH